MFNNKFLKFSGETPYPYWIFDNLLSEDVVDEALKEWPHNEDERWFRGYKSINGKTNILENGMLAISDFDKIPEKLRLILEFFHSDEFTNFLRKELNRPLLVSDAEPQWSGLRTMMRGSYQLIHSDARTHPKTGLVKQLSCLFYLNKNWEPKDEGCLELWDDEVSFGVERISPVFNRLAIFENSNTSYHGVPVVKSDRRAITFSVMNDVKNNHERKKALFVPRPQDPKEVEEIGIARSK
jgi:Rps23 Pro-64 3,4-dihydroxylase Tpa1-like proline 4-hydroxylase